MGFAMSIFLVAVGAVLAFAVSADVSGVSIDTVGWILLVVGLVSGALSLILWSTRFGPGYYTDRRRRTTTVDEGPPPH